MSRRRVLLLLTIGLLMTAIITIGTLYTSEADSLKKLYKEAEEAMSEGDFKNSIVAFEKVIEINPDHVDARLNLADAYMASSKQDEAIELLQEGISLNPEEHELYLKLSSILLQDENVSEAFTTLQKGKTYNNHKSIQRAYEKLTSEIFIHIGKTDIQKGFKRKLKLVWNSESGKQIPLNANWILKDESIGNLVIKDETAEFATEKVGKTTITAEWQTLKKEIEITVHNQVMNKLTLNPEKVESLVVGQTLNITLKGLDEAGKEMEFTPKWSATEGLIEIIEATNQSATFKAQKEGKGVIKGNYKDEEVVLPVIVKGSPKNINSERVGEGTIILTPLKDSYTYGEKITAEAKPETGWEFVQWKGDLNSSISTVHITVKEDMQLRAVFEKLHHKLSLSISGEGKIIRDSTQTKYPHGDKVTLKAKPKAGWKFLRWEGSYSSIQPTITLKMKKNHRIRAVFKKKQADQPPEDDSPSDDDPSPKPEPPTYSLSLNTSGEGNISKSKSGNRFKEGTKVTVTATPTDGWEFKGWSGYSSSSSKSITVTMKSDITLKAIFEKKPEPKETFSLVTSVVGQGTINTSAKTVTEGEKITITAMPADGWSFVSWQGDLSGSSSLATITMDSNKQITAVFEPINE
ncbi:InlB B-repeat-containing protein [Halobacillus yeomjeoni]|uniref:InlB B-repeat-containing protein n=1 Tax=Halobacillus yeomjeoni TaxID=311194 RepID=A0A931HWN8_9BACI|nr:InlB B-repeat-containing protein [Halobacillus yeomjeoni]MBH0230736.1 InlB B-repeat-containing protein [Halobacillus yeomjeoni]